MPPPEIPGALSRRALLRSALVGAAGLSTLSLLRPAAAQIPNFIPDFNAPSLAVGGGTGGNLAAVNAALQGTGLFIGNEGQNWTDAQWQNAFNRISAWGFDFVCPKVGGYGYTWYASDTQLQNWRAMANSVGLGYCPFIYSIPSTYVRDAHICADLANNCGIAMADMEDEWGASGSTNYNAEMADFGNIYRSICPNLPILVSGYGDPTTRFGSAASWPNAQVAAWADGYSPQWYYGYWSTYGGNSNNVKAAINWGDAQCGQCYGNSFPLVPEMDIYSAYSQSGVLPAADLTTGQTYAKLWKAPIFWWEYGGMTNAIAAALVPQNVTASVRISLARLWYTPVWRELLQTVTLTNTSGSALTGPLQLAVTGLPSGTTLVNAIGAHHYSPYLTATAAPALAPGASVSVQLRFRAPSLRRFTYGVQVFSGSF